jgi:hypothetical protein
MKKNQTSKSNGRENFLCPFTDVYITQDNGVGSHKGTKAYDIRGARDGVKFPYYAPCTCKLIWRDLSNGQGLWQSVAKVNFANGRVDYATFMTAHDETFDAKINQVVKQGKQLGNMGSKAGGGAKSTGVHCHIEIAQAKYTMDNWHKNKYGIYCFPKEYSVEDSCYMDGTNIIKGLNKKWKYLSNSKPSKKEKVDQILHVGSKVQFNGVFKVDILKLPLGSNLFGCTQLTGCSVKNYKNGKCKSYDWIRANDFIECDKKGNKTKDQLLTGGKSYVKNSKTYEVKQIIGDSAMINTGSYDSLIKAKYLREV